MDCLEDYMSEVDCMEADFFYKAQLHQETIHGEAYAVQIEAMIEMESEKEELFSAFETMPCIKDMRTWVMTYTDKSHSIEDRLVAMAFIEGVMFSGPFCHIQWLKERNKCPGITTLNEFICRDENVHCQFSCVLIKSCHV